MSIDRPVIMQYLGGLDTGGAESIVRDYAIDLKRRGYKVIVPLYYTTPELPNQIILSEKGIEMPFSRGRYSRNIILRGYNKFLSIIGHDKRFLRKLIQEYKPSIIHMHGYVLGDFDGLDVELEGVKLFYTCHTHPEFLFNGEWEFQKLIAQNLIDKHGMRMIAINEQMKQQLNAMFNISSTRVLNNPIDLKKYMHPVKEKLSKRKELGIPENAFVIGHVGRFDIQKNHIFLIDVFEHIMKTIPNAFLIMVGGDGNQKETIKSIISNKGLSAKSRMLSDRCDLPEIYNTMDCFVFPSLVEGFGIALLEAQAAHLKCYCSNNIPPNAIVVQSTVQMSLEMGAEGWAKKICEDVSNGACNGTRETEEALKKYDIISIVDMLTKWYEDEG